MKFKTYNEQINFLKTHPDEIDSHWNYPSDLGPLFKKLGSAEDNFQSDEPLFAGCLTQIRKFDDFAVFVHGKRNLAMTEQIRNDDRIPDSRYKITVESLEVFKEWQEKYDELVKQQS